MSREEGTERGADDLPRRLVNAWRGDEAALNELVRQHIAEVRRYVRANLGPRLRHKNPTDDVIQDAMIRLLKTGPWFTVSDQRAFVGILCRLCLRAILDKVDYFGSMRRDWNREAKPRSNESFDVDRFQARAAKTPSQELIAKEDEDTLAFILAQLPPQDEEIIRLECLEGMKPADVAVRLGVSQAAARMRRLRALQRLADVYQAMYRGR